MGRVSRKMIQEYRRQHEELDRAPRQFASDRPNQNYSFDELAPDACDPLHALYLSVQNFSARFAVSISMSSDFKEGEFEEYRAAVMEAAAEYAPGAPTGGPLTVGYFALWSVFDLRFGEDRETMGSCLVDLTKAMEAEPTMITVLENLCASRMGVYEHCGAWEDRLRLRELITGDEFVCYSTSGYQGEKGQLWYVRLCPPLLDYGDDHVVLTTPYVLIESSRDDWMAYLNKSLIGSTVGRREALASFLKVGDGRFLWHEFIFQAFHHAREDAIFLAGLPDVPASLPRSRARSRSDKAAENGAQGSGIGAASPPAPGGDDEASSRTWTVRFSVAQRRAIAAIRPELAGRLKLDEKRPRSIELTCGELDQVELAAETALPEARGFLLQPLKKILLAVREAKRSAAAHCVYQLQMTWGGADPPVWRRIQIRDCSLYDLHHYIQAAMGWENGKWYTFFIRDVTYIQSYPVADPIFLSIEDHPRRLSEALSACQSRCGFEYGHGLSSNPKLSIELEFVQEPDAETRCPVCIAGGVGYLPERRGGVSGYCDFVKAIVDPHHEKRREAPSQGAGCDPGESNAQFDAQAVTQAMRRQAQ